MAQPHRPFDDIDDVPYLVEFSMWGVVLLAATAIFLAAEAIALHAGHDGLANVFVNASRASIQITVGVVVWPTLYLGAVEVAARTPTLSDWRNP